MDADYKLTVSVERVAGHEYNGMSLYIFKGIQADATGEPTVWLKYEDWQEGDNEMTWTEHYKAYISTSKVQNGVKINCTGKEDIRLGETLVYKDLHGAKEKVIGTENVISIRNNTDNKKTCGLMQPNTSGADAPICAFELEGNFTVQMKPYITLILFWATTSRTDTGSVVERAFGDGIQINYGDDKAKAVSFATTGKWKPETFTTPIKSESMLGPLLVKKL